MASIRFKDRALAWKELGSGVPLVLLHGFCEDSRMWQSFIPFLADAGYRVIAPDLPGFGGSDPTETPGIPQMAEAVEQLLTHLHIHRPILIGHSMGGYTALEMMARKKIALSGLGLFHSHPYADDEDKKKARQKSIDFIGRHGLKPYLRDFYRGLFLPVFIDQRPYVLHQLRSWAEQYQAPGVQAALQAMAERRDHQETLRQADIPILFLLGLEDPLLPKEQLLAQTHLPRTADIQLLAGVAHMGPFEEPDLCVRAIRRFADFCRTHIPITA